MHLKQYICFIYSIMYHRWSEWCWIKERKLPYQQGVLNICEKCSLAIIKPIHVPFKKGAHGIRLTNQWNHLLCNCDFKLNESKVLISMVDPIDENHYLVVVEVLNGNIFLFVVNEIDDLIQEHLFRFGILLPNNYFILKNWFQRSIFFNFLKNN